MQRLAALGAILLTSSFSFAQHKAILSDPQLLRELNIPVVMSKPELGVALARVTPAQEAALSARAHALGRCAGYEAVPQMRSFRPVDFEDLFKHMKKPKRGFTREPVKLEFNADVAFAVDRVDEDRIRGWVEWLSSFPTRFHSGPQANVHTVELKSRVEQFMSLSKLKYEVEFVDHRSTPQKSLRVRLPGTKRPQEVVVLGGHYDSINHEIFGGTAAPGADDNASGSGSLLEALRVLSENAVQPERTVEFIWYAAEEVGLYGSSEIAQTYRKNSVDVVGVMQLDMTLHPGSGELVMASMTDFTSPWLREVFAELNRHYVGAKILSDQCGYGCSDHASWHRQGYPTVMPFEATMRTMNKKIHTRQDVINSQSNFRHATAFSKAAVAFAMTLANSELREN